MGLREDHRPTTAPSHFRPTARIEAPNRGAAPLAAVLLGALALLFAGLLAVVVRDALRVDRAQPERALGSDAGYPRSAQFPGGLEFQLGARPTRLVATTARAIDFLAALCDPDEIAGFPEQALEYATLEPEKEAALAGAGRFYAYTAEPVLRLGPDLVVADLWQSADTHARLVESGVPLLVLPELVDWNDVRQTVLALGHLLDRDARAEALVGDTETRLAALAARAAERPRLRALTYSNFGSKGFTAGRGTSVHEILILAGLENAVAADGRDGHLEITFEELLRLDPDVIVVSAPLNTPVSHTGDRGGASEAILKGEPSLANLRAVRTGSIVVLPAGLFACNSHRMVRAAEVLSDAVADLGASVVGGPR